MPYYDRAELPVAIKNNLPAHAQTIYRKAYNNAWDQYDKPSEREQGGSREEVSHRVAWSAVKKKYKKSDSDKWVRA